MHRIGANHAGYRTRAMYPHKRRGKLPTLTDSMWYMRYGIPEWDEEVIQYTGIGCSHDCNHRDANGLCCGTKLYCYENIHVNCQEDVYFNFH